VFLHLLVFCILGFGLNALNVGHVFAIVQSSGIVSVMRMRLASASGGQTGSGVVTTCQEVVQV